MSGFRIVALMRRERLAQSVRTSFIYGFVVVLPIAITLWIVNHVISIVSWPFLLIYSYKINRFVAFLLSMVIIFVIGSIARHFIGKSFLETLEKGLSHIPLVRTVYKSSKQIISSFTLQKKNQMEVVALQFPQKGMWVVGYLSQHSIDGFPIKDSEDKALEGKVSVFVPTAPNPTTGYLVFVDRDEIIHLAMTFEEAMKLTVSMGTLSFAQIRQNQ